MGLLVIVARGVGHCGRVVTGPYRDRVGGVVCNCDAHEGRREQGREHQAAGRQHDTASIGAACPSGSLQNEHARPKRREKMWEAPVPFFWLSNKENPTAAHVSGIRQRQSQIREEDIPQQRKVKRGALFNNKVQRPGRIGCFDSIFGRNELRNIHQTWTCGRRN